MTVTQPTSASHHCYVCEAGSIQDYLLSTGRLRDIVGGSEMLEMLWNELRDEVLTATGVRDKIQFARSSGGAFYALTTDREALDSFHALFSVAAAQFAPGLILEQGRGSGESPYKAYEASMRNAKAGRNLRAADLPVAGPFALRDPRTGRPAGGHLRLPRQSEIVDLPTQRFDLARKGSALQGRAREKTLTDKFASDAQVCWPVNLSPDEGDRAEGAFPFTGETQYVGLIYADGSGMAAVSKKVKDHIQALEARGYADAFVTVFSQFSQAITEATEQAAADATRAVLLPNAKGEERVMPARPIVLGGDDLAIIVRADLALDFARHFLRAFEQASEQALRRVVDTLKIDGLPRRLTAAVGIAYARSSQPYARLHALAEEIGDHAKKMAKRWKQAAGADEVPSVMAWHRVTTSLFGDYEDEIIERELTARAGEAVRLSLPAYSIDRLDGLPCLDDLIALVDLLSPKRQASRGPMRGLVTALSRDDADARRRYRRWREVQSKAEPGTVRQFDDALRKLVGEPDHEVALPCGQIRGEIRYSPMADVMALLAVGRSGAEDSQEGKLT